MYMFNNEVFSTQFKNSEIEIDDIEEYLFGYKTEDRIIDTTSSASLDYKFSAEIRSWGIKSIFAHFTSCFVQIEWFVEKEYLTDKEISVLQEKGGEETKYAIKGVIYIDTNKLKYTFDNQVEFESDGGYHFSMMYVNLMRKEITFVS